MMINLPEKFELYDIVIFTEEKRIWGSSFRWCNFADKHLHFVTKIDWGGETAKLDNNSLWYSFLDLKIVKKNCPITRLIV